jgi:epsin
MVFKGTLRAVKNVTNGYSDAEAKVRTITSNDSVIPSGAQMNELAQMSYNQYDLSSPRDSSLMSFTINP